MRLFISSYSWLSLIFFLETIVFIPKSRACAIVDAIQQEDQEKAIEFIWKSSGAFPEDLDQQDTSGNAPIHFAAYKGFDKVVHALIDAGADLNIKNKRGEEATIIAFRLNHKSVLELLLLNGAKFDYASLSRHLSRIALTPKLETTKPKRGSSAEQYSKLFIDNIANFISDDSRLKMLVYLYPIFVSEKVLFSELLKLSDNYGNPIRKFLYYLAAAGLPNGTENLAAAGNELNKLMEKVVSSPVLHDTLTKSLSGSPKTPLSSSQKHPFQSLKSSDKFDFRQASAEHLAFLFTLRDTLLMRNLTLKEIRIWIENAEQAHSIIALANHFNRTSKLIAYDIVSEKDKKKRKLIFKKWINVAYEMYRLNNFHGVMQVLIAINCPSISRLYSIKKLVKKKPKCAAIQKMWHVETNFGIHRNLIAQLGPQQNFVPPFPMVLHDLQAMLEVLHRSQNEDHYNFSLLENLERLVKLLIHYREKANYPFDITPDISKQLNLINELADNESETIEEHSSLIIEWSLPRSDPKDKDLEKWNSSEFVFWLTNKGMKQYIFKLFQGGVEDGKKLASILDELDYKEQLIMLEQKFLIPYHSGLLLVTLNSPRRSPEKKNIFMWDCVDLGIWFSPNIAIFSILLINNIWSGLILMDLLRAAPPGSNEQLNVLVELGIPILEANNFLAFLSADN
jgi:hypothetical protein